MVPREIIAGEVLSEWQNHKISSAVSKVYDFYRLSAIIHDHTESCTVARHGCTALIFQGKYLMKIA